MTGTDGSDPSLFYTGLVANLYSTLRSFTPDPEPYARFIDQSGEPALELGCGEGDPLLELRRRGLDVEGVDASPDMLERCRTRAAAAGLDVTLHEARIERMDLGRRYRSIFLAGATFNLLPDDATAQQALDRIAAHLEPGGSALIPLFVPAPTPTHELNHPREQCNDDGTVMRVATVHEHRDDAQRRQTSVLRYELETADGTEVLERPWVLHWHTQDGFRALLDSTPLEVTAILDRDGRTASPSDQQFTFWVTHNPA